MNGRTFWRVASAILLTALLAACSSTSPKSVASKPANHSPTVAAGEDLWHLRSGLNVAALNCRGPNLPNIAPAYNRLLRKHSSTLALAADTEKARFRGKGGNWQRGYDTHLTQVYNRFSNSRNRKAFCNVAAKVAARANAASPAELTRDASHALDELENGLSLR
jgi:hypothetical protein